MCSIINSFSNFSYYKAFVLFVAFKSSKSVQLRTYSALQVCKPFPANFTPQQILPQQAAENKNLCIHSSFPVLCVSRLSFCRLCRYFKTTRFPDGEKQVRVGFLPLRNKARELVAIYGDVFDTLCLHTRPLHKIYCVNMGKCTTCYFYLDRHMFACN